MALNPYASVETEAQPQNELEARALVRTASRLNIIKENFEERSAELTEALDLNRKLWTVLVSDVCEESNPLPVEIKQNIVNLAYFIFKKTFAIMAKPDPKDLDVLIDINMNIARGLNEQTKNRLEQQSQKDSTENHSEASTPSLITKA